MKGEIRILKNKILIKIRNNFNNLFTFAKATPIVLPDGTPCSDETRQRIDMRTKVKESFGETQKEIQVKFDILSQKFLQDVVRRGTRLLHITSDYYDSDHLYLEGEAGICEKIRIEELKMLIGTTSKIKTIEVVSVALP